MDSPAPVVSGPPFLVVPTVETGRGGGHLSRCAALVRKARALGREAFLFPCGGPSASGTPLPAQGYGAIPLLDGLDPSWIIDKPVLDKSAADESVIRRGVEYPAPWGGSISTSNDGGVETSPVQNEKSPRDFFFSTEDTPLLAAGFFIDEKPAIDKEPAGRAWDFIVLDRFQTPPGEYRFWSSLGPIIGIDEGGPCRDRFDFLLDLLPGPPGRSRPNILDPGLLPLPRRPMDTESAGTGSGEPADAEPGKPAAPLSVLISFGAEDRARLGRRCAAALCSPGIGGGTQGLRITLVDPQGSAEGFDAAQGPNAVRGSGAAEGRGPPAVCRASRIKPLKTGFQPVFYPANAESGPGNRDFCVIGGAKIHKCNRPPELEVLGGIPSLGEHLAEYDLLVTHFGLSAFEALHAGVPVILVSPGPYHRRLAETAGFVSAGVGSSGARRLGRLLAGLLKDPEGLANLRERCRSLARRHGLAGEQTKSFAGLIAAFQPRFLTRRCPCCGESGGPAPARFPRRSFRRCPRCGVIYQSRIGEPPVEYAREYFFEFYKQQYGKTYIEDFPNLTAMAQRRLARILPLLPESLRPKSMLPERPIPGPPPTQQAPRLLDIGCAYGAFLRAASRSGFLVLGLDPAEDAVRHVRDTLGLPARRGFFPPGQEAAKKAAELGPPASFAVISLWYVIEHFRDPAGALEECRRLLMDGGVLAFSTPSASGISGRTSPAAFLEHSPQDHWTVWSPRSCRRILKTFGFSLRRIVITGHHPERFPLLGRFCRGAKGPVYRALLFLSRAFRLGDTFEAYAVKEPRRKGCLPPC